MLGLDGKSKCPHMAIVLDGGISMAMQETVFSIRAYFGLVGFSGLI